MGGIFNKNIDELFDNKGNSMAVGGAMAGAKGVGDALDTYSYNKMNSANPFAIKLGLAQGYKQAPSIGNSLLGGMFKGYDMYQNKQDQKSRDAISASSGDRNEEIHQALINMYKAIGPK